MLRYQKSSFVKKQVQFNQSTTVIQTLFLSSLFLCISLFAKSQTIAVDPPSLSAIVPQCQGSVSKTFTIENNGSDVLNYTLAADYFNSKLGGKILETYDGMALYAQISGSPVVISGMVFVGDTMYYLEYESSTLNKFDIKTGKIINQYSVHYAPVGLTFDGTNFWIGNSNGELLKYNMLGVFSGKYINLPYSSFTAVTFDGKDFIIAELESSNTIIYKVDVEGKVLETYNNTTPIIDLVWIPSHKTAPLTILNSSKIINASILNKNITVLHEFPFMASQVLSITHNGNDLFVGSSIAGTSRDKIAAAPVSAALVSPMPPMPPATPMPPMPAPILSPAFRISDGIEENANWMKISENSGTLNSGTSKVVTVEYNTADLNGGVAYEGGIVVQSNDPINNIVAVKSNLEVGGSYQVRVSKKAISFGKVMTGNLAYDTVKIYNDGCEVISLASYSFSPNFYFERMFFMPEIIILPHDSLTIPIVFSPTNIQLYDYSFSFGLTNSSGSSDEYILLSGSGVGAPVMSIPSSTITTAITQCNGTVSQTFDIYNSGSGNLNYSVEHEGIMLPVSKTILNGNIHSNPTNYVFTSFSANTSIVHVSILLSEMYLVMTNGSYLIDIEGKQFNVNIENIKELTQSENVTLKNGLLTFILKGNDVKNYLADGKLFVNVSINPFVGSNLYEISVLANNTNFITFSPSSGIVPAGASQTITANYNASTLKGGIVQSSILVNSNDPIYKQHTIASTIYYGGTAHQVIKEQNIAFGNVEIGIYKEKTFQIYNNGCDTLQITDATLSNNNFNLIERPTLVLPSDSGSFMVRFQPSDIGFQTSSITIIGNVGTSTVTLTATGIEKPEFNVFPTSISASVNQCKSTASSTFVISNTGSSTLTYSSNINFVYYNKNGTENYSPDNKTLISTFSGFIPTTDSIFVMVPINPEYFIFGSGFYTLSIDGDKQEDINYSTYLQNNVEGIMTCRLKFSGSNVTKWLSDGKLIVELGNLDNETRILVAVTAFKNNLFTLSPSTGNVISGSSTTVTVNFDASLLAVNNYVGKIELKTNDPLNLKHDIPFNFDYSGNASISVSTTSIDLGTAFVNGVATKTIWIKNTTCGTLNVNSMICSSPTFNVQLYKELPEKLTIEKDVVKSLAVVNDGSQTMNILHGDSLQYIVTFRPTIAGNDNATLTILSNSATQTIELTGVGIVGPDLKLDKMYIVDTIKTCGSSEDTSFVISNTGKSTLTYKLYHEADWIKLSNIEGSIAVGESKTINVTFDASKLIAGNYSDYIVFTTNIPRLKMKPFKCNLHVKGLPVINIAKTEMVFPKTMINTSVYGTLPITNTGCDTLKIHGIDFASPDFYCATTSTIVLPNETLNTIIYFNPNTVNSVTSTLTLVYNGGTSTIKLSGSGNYPSVLGVNAISNNGYYNASKTIELDVYFNSTIDVDVTEGTPTLQLNTIPVSYATYHSNLSDRHLVFSYTVGATDNSAHLDYAATNSLQLNGAKINGATNTISLVLPTPGVLASSTNIVIDNQAPVITIEALTTSPTAVSPITFRISSTEKLKMFGTNGLSCSSGPINNLRTNDNGNSWLVDVSIFNNGLAEFYIFSNTISDIAGNFNTVGATCTVIFDPTLPVISLSSFAGTLTNINPIVIVLESSVVLTNLDASKFKITNGTVSKITEIVEGKKWFVNVVPTTSGMVKATVATNTVSNVYGYTNTDSAYFETYFDGDAPLISISSNVSNNTNKTIIPVTIQFNKKVFGFTLSDIVVSNATVSNFTSTDNEQIWSVNVSPISNGAFTLTIPTGATHDKFENYNLKTIKEFVFDNNQPTATLSTNSLANTNLSTIPVKVEFSESVVSFNLYNINVKNGSVSNLRNVLENNSWTFDVIPSASDSVIVTIPANTVFDKSGNGNVSAIPLSVNFNNVLPSVIISTTNASITNVTNSQPILVKFEFSKAVTGFTTSDIIVGNGTVSNLQTTANNKTYFANINPISNGLVTIDVLSGSAIDAFGNNNAAATQFRILFDTVLPSLVISTTSASITNSSSIDYKFEFSEVVTDFTLNDITVENGIASNFTPIAGSKTWTLNVKPTNNGIVSVGVSANMVVDIAGNKNASSTIFTNTFDAETPSVIISSTVDNITKTNPTEISIAFNKPVNDFTLSDILVINGVAINLKSKDSKKWTADIVSTSNGQITVSIPASSVIDIAGNTNSISNSITYKFDGTLPIITNLKISNFVSTTAEVSFTSNKTGKVYFVVMLSTANVPTFDQIISGATELSPIFAGNTGLSQSVAKAVTINGLVQNTSYKLYVVVEDELKNNSEVISTDFSFYALGLQTISDNDVKLYPNPITSVLNIELKNTNDKTSYQLFSISGTLIQKGTLNGVTERINFDNYAPNTYILRLSNGNSYNDYKVIKK